jgi:anthranilate phosphoribosyltransferase
MSTNEQANRNHDTSCAARRMDDGRPVGTLVLSGGGNNTGSFNIAPATAMIVLGMGSSNH